MTVGQLERTMGAQELDDWVAFYGVEPWGAYRDNLHAGIIASAIVNMAPNRKRGAKAVKPGDFVLRAAEEKRAQDTRKSLNYLRAIGVKKSGNGPS